MPPKNPTRDTNPVLAAASGSTTAVNGGGTSAKIDPAGAVASVITYANNTVTAARQDYSTAVTKEQKVNSKIVENKAKQLQTAGDKAMFEAKTALSTEKQTLEVLDPDSITGSLKRLTSRQRDLELALAAKDEEVMKIHNTSIEKDGFFPWLKSLIEAPFAEQERNATVVAYNNNNAMINRLNQSNTEVAQAVRSVQVTKTAAQLDLLDKSIKESIDAARLESVKSNILLDKQAVTDLLTMDKEAIDLKLRAMSEQRQWSATKLATSKWDAEQQNDEHIAKVLNKVRANAGVPLITPEDVTSARTLGGDTWANMSQTYDIGVYMGEVEAGNRAPIGDSTLQAVKIMSLVNPNILADNTPTNKFLAKVKAELQAKVLSEQEKTGITMKDLQDDPKLLEKYMQETINAMSKKDAEAIYPEQNNLYRIPPVDVMKEVGAVTQMPIYTEVIAKNNYGQTMNEQDFMDDMVAYLNSSKPAIKVQDMANQIADYFSIGKAYNTTTNNYSAMHLPDPLDYPTMLSVGGAGGFFGDTESVDLTDATSVLSYLLKRTGLRNKKFPSVLDNQPVEGP